MSLVIRNNVTEQLKIKMWPDLLAIWPTSVLVIGTFFINLAPLVLFIKNLVLRPED